MHQSYTAMTTHDIETIGQETIAVENVEVSAESARLIVQVEPTDPHTRVLDLPVGAEVTFGRSRSSTVHVDSESVSRTHARLTCENGRITIEDLGSRNGTRVNGTVIDGPRTLASGDEIRVGPSVAILSVTSRLGRPVPLGTTTHLDERLAAEVDRGLRFRRTFGLVMLRLEGGDDACDAALSRMARVARPMDVLVEYGADDLAVLLPEADRRATIDHATRLAQAARSGDVVVRAGAAVFPECATHAHELLSRARESLRAARRDRRDEPVVASPDEATVQASSLIVADPQMERVFELARRVADHSITVLITGETGAGKEVVAEEIHRAGSRRDGPFARLNCASIPETLLESELFGHERGAFTGADRRKSGHFEAADGGTVFLDEIGEISPAVQAKLLRVLEERRFSRVGSTDEIEVDVRVVCATNRDLEREVQSGRFREDLFFRVSAFTIIVPPLRDRPGEIIALAEHFLSDVAGELGHPAPGLSPETQALLRSYHWPGNVRELRNAMERAVVMQSGGVIEPSDLPESLRASRAQSPSSAAGDVRDRVAEVERNAIIEALDACEGNQTHAARRLGLSRRALIYKLEKYGLKRPPLSRQ